MVGWGGPRRLAASQRRRLVNISSTALLPERTMPLEITPYPDDSLTLAAQSASSQPLLHDETSSSSDTALQPPSRQHMLLSPSDAARGTPRSRHPCRPPRLRAVDDVPRYMICPLGGTLMRDPVLLEDGYSYERQNLCDWLQTKQQSPKTRAPLASRKYFDNHLLREAIEARQAWLAVSPRPPAHKAWYFTHPMRSVHPFVEPLCLSDGHTYDQRQFDWLDGKRRSPAQPQQLFRHDELRIPNLAVAAMVEDAGFAPCVFGDYSSKYKLWTPKPKPSADNSCQAMGAGGLMGALCGAGILQPLAEGFGLVVLPAQFGVTGLAGCMGGAIAGGLVHCGEMMRYQLAEEQRQNCRRPL